MRKYLHDLLSSIEDEDVEVRRPPLALYLLLAGQPRHAVVATHKILGDFKVSSTHLFNYQLKPALFSSIYFQTTINIRGNIGQNMFLDTIPTPILTLLPNCRAQ